MTAGRSMVISMRLPTESGMRLKRMPTGMAGRQATPARSLSRRVCAGRSSRSLTFAIHRQVDRRASRELTCSMGDHAARSHHKGDVAAVAKHLGWPLGKVQAAVHYAEAFQKRSTWRYRRTTRPILTL